MSPIVIDAQTGRNAGRITLNEDGTITRPAQDCSTQYGACIHLCRHQVSPTDFNDLGVIRTLNAHAQVIYFHHVEYYAGITFHDCMEPH